MENKNNNKELFDEVINDMNNGAIDNTETDDNMDNSIQLKLSTGDVYLVDPDTFDWDNAIKNLPSMIENEDSLRNIMFSLLTIKDPTTEESVKTIQSIIKQIEDFMEGFQIHVSYERFDPNISDYKKAMMLVFDANNVVRTIVHNTQMMEMLSNITSIAGFHCCDDDTCECHDEEECSCCSDVEHCDEPDGECKIFEVSAIEEDGDIIIQNIEESDVSPDEVNIPWFNADTMYVYVCCHNEDEAYKEGFEILKANI